MDISHRVHAFLAEYPHPPIEIRTALKSSDNSHLLRTLALAALKPNLTQIVFTYFEPLALDLCARWSSQNRHAAVAAFGRVVDALPYISELAQRVIGGMRLDILNDLDMLNASDENVQQLYEVLLGLLRLLRFNNSIYAKLFRPAKLQILLNHKSRCIRYLAVRILCLYLHASDASFEDMRCKYLGAEPITFSYESHGAIDFTFFSLWEEKRIKDFKHHMQRTQSKTQTLSNSSIKRSIVQGDLSKNVVLVAGILSLCSDQPALSLSVANLVSTPTTDANLLLVAEALRLDEALLVTGLSGSGKSVTINHLAAQLGKSATMITLHMNEQSDAKLLVGIYTTGSEPGSFEWKPGVLTTAVTEGRWVLIEDLDRVPNEVLSTILPLIERRELSIPSRDVTIKAAPGFKIIATIRNFPQARAQEPSSGSISLSKILGQRLWHCVNFEPLQRLELRCVVIAQHPTLAAFVDQFMIIYENLQAIISTNAVVRTSSALRSRTVSVRELLKFCNRAKCALAEADCRTGFEAVPDHIFDSFYLDAADCFIGWAAEDAGARQILMTCIGEILCISPERRIHLSNNRNITFRKERHEIKSHISIGRTSLPVICNTKKLRSKDDTLFVNNNYSLRLLEQVAVAVLRRESILLVGETGIGKTTVVQQMANSVGQKLIAINLSQQSEVGDLLGGYKPVNIRTFVVPLKDEFDTLFDETFSAKKNQRFVEMLGVSVAKGKWKRAVTLWREALKMVDTALGVVTTSSLSIAHTNGQQSSKRRRVEPSARDVQRSRWNVFATKLHTLEHRLNGKPDTFAFAFVEGALIRAMKEGSWVLLDEINLATSDTLECLSGLLDAGPDLPPSLTMSETAGAERVTAHNNFRVFAAMNPATDVGKKDLPLGIRSRFTEIFVNSPDSDPQSLRSIVDAYLGKSISSKPDISKLGSAMTDLYLETQQLVTANALVDGAGQKPQFSLRSLTRALNHALKISALCSLRRALYEGFSMCFLTSLDNESEIRLHSLLKSKLFRNTAVANGEISKPLRAPENVDQFVSVSMRVQGLESAKKPPLYEQVWLPLGKELVEEAQDYIITPYIHRNIRNVIRALSNRRHPVLIQGPTSAGKTSMVEYLAKRSGNKFVRINNHEHTDLQEYLGTYISNSDGQIIFQEGLLVQALRHGHWVVLDELNLAPSDVLEALNRLLDDNKELLIPETQEIVRPHPNFMLFATQNPAGPYGGRKALSRAFRNRFLELHFDDIPVDELNIILAKRSDLPESWCRMIIDVYKRLSQLRQESRVFEQQSFATLRDLFRWAFRGADTVEALAITGYMLLAEKVRKQEECDTIRDVIQSTMSQKGVQVRVDDDFLYGINSSPDFEAKSDDVVWTKAMRRIYILVAAAMKHHEPVLLVGETGCGKTTVCQILAAARRKILHTVNVQQNTETGDLIGAQRPVRNKGSIDEDLRQDLILALHSPENLEQLQTMSLEILMERYDTLQVRERANVREQVHDRVRNYRRKRKTLFEWQDGSLVRAMRSGDFYLLDEISLAEDSVLERVNSVLDPARTILLAEKGTADSLVVAHSDFQFLATMNPGGDFGKKELSPALRNRFTEIWVPPLSDVEDLLQIVHSKIRADAAQWAETIVRFTKWFGEYFRPLQISSVSVRDILAWIEFINNQHLDSLIAVVHGAAMVFIDALGANPSGMIAGNGQDLHAQRKVCLDQLSFLLKQDVSQIYNASPDISSNILHFQIGYFGIPVLSSAMKHEFNFNAPIARLNAMRLLRGLQLSKPLLLEGSPGVGKTAIVTAIAAVSGNSLTRVNLSEQTDLMDLFGSDVPVDGAEAGVFAWRDAPFLTAMKSGNWVLLDEMNLASQSVLEGLNACLDHRGEVYIAELDQVFKRHTNFRLFAAQNPHHQGGGRKGLPSSFVNRFTVVYADVFKQEDLLMICTQQFPSILPSTVGQIVNFVTELDRQISQRHDFGLQGSPWEFNLRDSLRCLQMLSSANGLLPAGNIHDFIDILFFQRFRVPADVTHAKKIAHAIIGDSSLPRNFFTNLSSQSIQVGLALLQRREESTINLSNMPVINVSRSLPLMESIMLCVQQNWPVILTGISGAGKTYMLESIASVVGADIDVLAMTSDLDATDLVGGYEQMDSFRHAQEVVRKAYRGVQSVLMQCLRRKPIKPQVALEELMLGLFELLGNSLSGKIDVTAIVEATKNALMVFSTEQNTESQRLFGNVQLLLEKLHNATNALSNTSAEANAARFEWVDGTLVRALQQGKWLVLDNANLCSSSVLDRLNSLLEPNGCLIMNEHSLDDGSARIIRPHPNFRIFLTLDPRYGEISRAMRNRAVELYVSPQQGENSREGPSLLLESRMSRLHQLIHMNGLSDFQAINGLLANAAIERLAAADIQIWMSFIQQVSKGLACAAIEQHCSSGISHWVLTMFDTHQSWLDPTLSVYKHMERQIGELPGTVQPNHIMVNQPLLLHPAAAVANEALLWVSTNRQLSLDLVHMDAVLLDVQQSQPTSDKMTCMERSFASLRAPRAKKDPNHWIAPLLQNLVRELKRWIVSADFQSRDCKQDIQKVLDVPSFWWTFFNLASTSSDIVELRSCLEVGRQHFGRLGSQDSLVSLFSALRHHFDGAVATNKAKTGLSMDRMWLAFRPELVQTYDHLQDILRIEALADRFDEIVWHLDAPIDQLQSIRGSLVKALDLVRSQQISSKAVVEEAENILSRMSISEDVEDTGCRPYFGDCFEALCQTNALNLLSFQSGRRNFKPILLDPINSMLASRKTKAPNATLEISSNAQTLTCISAFMGFSRNSESSPISSALHLLLLEKIANIDDVTLKQLPLVQHELSILGSAISSRPHILCSGQNDQLGRIFRHLIVQVLDIHSDFLNEEWLNDLKAMHSGNESSAWDSKANSFIMAADLPTDHFLRIIIERNFSQVYQNQLHSGLSNCFDLADMILNFGLGCLRLYVPDKPYDPSLKSAMEHRVHQSKKQGLLDNLSAVVQVERHLTGQETSLRCRALQNQIENLGPAPKIHAIARPPTSQMGQLYGDLSTIERSLGPAYEAESLMKISQSTRDSMLQNVTQVIPRLNDRYRAYDDITKPIVGFLQCVRLGLLMSMTKDALTESKFGNVVSVLEHLPFMRDPSIQGSLDNLDQHQSKTSDLDLEYQQHLLMIQSLKACIDNTFQSSVLLSITKTFNFFYGYWRKQLEADQKKDTADHSLYQYRGGYEDETEADEEQFSRMFPDYEEVVENKGEMDISLQSPRLLAISLARLHQETFTPKTSSADRLETAIKDTAMLMGKRISPDHIRDCDIDIQRLLPAIFLTAQDTSKNLSSFAPQGQYNIYTDSNISEVQKVRDLIKQIQTWVKPVVEAWPEQAALNNTIRTCHDLLAIGHAQPVMKFLPKTQSLYAHLAEWQSVASREYSASAMFDKVTNLLISWRQLELSTWARLLDIESRQCEEDAMSWWFVAYENILAIPLSLNGSIGEMQAHTPEVLRALETFITNSTMGQYSRKLALLRSLNAHVAILAKDDNSLAPLATALENFLFHFSRFTPAIDEFISQGRQKLEKDVRNVIQLASWKDRNVEALKQNAKASHRQLFRIIKKYRKLLSQPVASTLGQAHSRLPVNAIVSPELKWSNASLLNESALAFVKGHGSMWNQRPERFKNTLALSNALRRKAETAEPQFDVCSSLDDWLAMTEKSIQHLQDATPSSLTKDNAVVVKHVTTRKRKLFTDTLKDIRHMGLKSNQNPGTLNSQETLAKVLASMPTSHGLPTIPAELAALQDLHENLDRMPEVRKSSQGHSDDIQPAEISRCISNIEGFLAISLRQRRNIREVLSQLHQLDSSIKQINTLWHDEKFQSVVQENDEISTESDVKTKLQWMPTIIEVAARIIQAQANLGGLDFDILTSGLRHWSSQFETARLDVSNQPPSPARLTNFGGRALLASTSTQLNDFNAQVDQWIVDFPLAELTLRHLSAWPSSLSSSNFSEPASGQISNNKAVNHQLFKALDVILASAQDTERTTTLFPTSEEDNKWFTQTEEAFKTTLTTHNISAVNIMLAAMLENLAHLNQVALPVACASLTIALPVIQQYQANCNRNLDRYANFHQMTCKVSSKLSKIYLQIATQGFCKPQEPSSEKSAGDDKLEEGTGLGEGEGAEDISKDIGDDEDLSELAQDPDNKNKNEIEDQQDAVSIDDEMEGAAGDGAENEDEDKEDKPTMQDEEQEGEVGDDDGAGGEGKEQDEDNPDNGMDEGVGEVDDFEPSAVDEKFWDQAGNEEDRQKEAKQSASDSKEDEQAAGDDKSKPKEEKDEDVGQDNADVDDASSLDGGSVSERSAGEPEQNDFMDPHVEESEAMELPEDLQLDGDKNGNEADTDEEMLGEQDFEEGEADPDQMDTKSDQDSEVEQQDGRETSKLDLDETNVGGQDEDEDGDPTGDGNEGAGKMDTGVGQKSTATLDDKQEQDESESKDNTNDNEDKQTGENESANTAEQESNEQNESGRNLESVSKQGDGQQNQDTQDMQAIKKLGNILEKWHRQQRQIREDPSQRDQGQVEQQDVDMADAEFEHLPDEEAESDAQALGASTLDQARALDDEMGLPSTEQDDEKMDQGFEPDVETLEDEDQDAEMQDTNANEESPLDGLQRTHNSVHAGADSNDMPTSRTPSPSPPSPPSTSLSTISLQSDPTTLWTHHSTRTHAHSLTLTQHLRLILAPTLATKLRGDFRTGKRLNMRRIIPYIASGYKRDKIWLRRSAPTKRSYQILLAIDDSKSMAESGRSALALDTLALVARALAALEVGELGVLAFGERVAIAHELGVPFVGNAGPTAMGAFSFTQGRTDVKRLIGESVAMLRTARMRAAGAAADLWQLELVVSDGICEDHDGIRGLLRGAMEERIMVVFVIVDATGSGASGQQGKQSILDLEKVEFVQLPGPEGEEARTKLQRRKYLDSFPFAYYLVVQDVRELPNVLANALRQWFAEVVER